MSFSLASMRCAFSSAQFVPSYREALGILPCRHPATAFVPSRHGGRKTTSIALAAAATV